MIRQLINRALSPENLEALHEAISQKVGDAFQGIASDEQGYSLLFLPTASAADQNAAIQLAMAFDIETRTTRQTEEAQQQADLDAALETLKGVDPKKPLTQDQTSALLKAVLHMAKQ